MDNSRIIWYVYFTRWMHLLYFNINANKPFVCDELFSTLSETARENRHLGNNFLECFAYQNNCVTGLYRYLDINYVNGFTIMYGEVKNKIYHTVRTVPKSNRKIAETEAKSIPLTHKDMTSHIPWYRHFNKQ